MKYLVLKKCALAALALTAFGLPYAAHAQYVWLDERGTKQYSDLPPPSSVPSNRILSRPGTTSAATPATSTETAAAPSRPEMTAAEKNADFRKRRVDQADKEKKAAEESRLAAEKAKYCERAREYNSALASGVRISRTDKNGERSFMTDEQRAQEQRDARRMLEDCK
ncbi:MAG: DUF4124 domain-containing protein [Noviherbaspirillum sp.]